MQEEREGKSVCERQRVCVSVPVCHILRVCLCATVHKWACFRGREKRREGRGRKSRRGYECTDMHSCFLPPPGALIERRLLLYKQEVHLKLKIKYLESRFWKWYIFQWVNAGVKGVLMKRWLLAWRACSLHQRVNSHLASPSQQWTQQPLKLYFCTLQMDHAAADCSTSQ